MSEGVFRVSGVRLAGAVALVFSSLACQSYKPQVALDLYAIGDFQAARDEIADPPWYRKHYDHDQMIWLLEEAKVLRDLGRYEESSEVFESALGIFREFVLNAPDVSVTDELAGLGSQVLRDYRGSFADGIMACTLLALNDLAVGNVSNARAAAREGYNWQTEAKLHFEKELARADELAKEKKLDNEAIFATPELKAEMDSVASYVQPGFADYLNPFASFVSGVAQCANAELAEAGLAFKEVLAMVPGNTYVEGLVSGAIEPANRTVFVLYERGMAPARQEFRVTLPTPHGLFSVAVPVLRPQPDAASHLAITGADLELQSEPLASMDSIIAAQFRKELPGIITRTVISSIIREVAGQAVNKAGKSAGEAGAFLRFFYQIFKLASTGADIRSWRTIGSEYQVAVFTLPADGTFDVRLIDRAGRPVATETVRLPAAPVSVVSVRSIGLHVLRVGLPASASIEG